MSRLRVTPVSRVALLLGRALRDIVSIVVYTTDIRQFKEIVAAEGLFTTLVKRYARPQPLAAVPSVNIIGPPLSAQLCLGR